MKQFKSIKQFVFVSAQYQIGDDSGTNVILKIDYEHNLYAVESMDGNIFNERFRQEVANIASDLLNRKHGVNFAKQVR